MLGCQGWPPAPLEGMNNHPGWCARVDGFITLELMRLSGSSQREAFAFTAIELLVIVTVVFVLGLVLIPGLVHARGKAQRISCAGNLRNQVVAFRLARLPGSGPGSANASPGLSPEDPSRYFRSLSNELVTPVCLVCCSDARQAAASFALVQPTNLSYFVNLAVTESQPGAVLVGDRNLTTNGVPVAPGSVLDSTDLEIGWSALLHRSRGNLAFADGSVAACDRVYTLRLANRLAIP